MTQNIYVQATKFIREIVQARKKATKKDVENFVEMLRKLNAPIEDLEYLNTELNNYINNKIIYFQKKGNKKKENEYRKVGVLMKKIIEYYKNNAI